MKTSTVSILLDSTNASEILAQVLLVAPAERHDAIKLALIKAVNCYKSHDRARGEITTETEDQFRIWSQAHRSPVIDKYGALAKRRDWLIGGEDDARRDAVKVLASLGVYFTLDDVSSVDALQEAIENSAPTSASIRVKLGVSAQEATTPIWIRGISDASPVLVVILTSNGLYSFVAHKSLFEDLYNPLIALFFGLGLATTIPVISMAMALGRRFASLTSTSRREYYIQLLSATPMTVALAAITAGLAAIDGIALASLGGRDALASKVTLQYLPLVALTFTTSAIISKVHQGYQQAKSAEVHDRVVSFQEEFVTGLRLKAARSIELVAEADSKAVELIAVREQLAGLETELRELGFDPIIPARLHDAVDDTAEDWQIASQEFWGLANSRPTIVERIGRVMNQLLRRQKEVGQ